MKPFLSLFVLIALALGAGCSHHSDALGVWKSDAATLTLEGNHNGTLTFAPVRIRDVELTPPGSIFGWNDLEDHEVGMTLGGAGDYFMNGKISDDGKTLTLRNMGQEITFTKS
jgi:hypothetical protein